jgi:ubiquinone/menaquinone biosynthesis C-methylase UbiE
MEARYWFIIGVTALLATAIVPYLILKYIYHKPLASIWNYLFCIFFVWSWILVIYETPGIRKRRLIDAGVKEGQTIVDLGCGIGRFVFIAAKIVGPEGKVYAIDIHPLHTAIAAVRRAIGGYKNVDIVYADCHATGLPDKTIDLVFINDAFHEFADKNALEEMERILKADGILAIDEHEMKERKFLDIIEKADLFTLIEQKKRLYKFRLTKLL